MRNDFKEQIIGIRNLKINPLWPPILGEFGSINDLCFAHDATSADEVR